MSIWIWNLNQARWDNPNWNGSKWIGTEWQIHKKIRNFITYLYSERFTVMTNFSEREAEKYLYLQRKKTEDWSRETMTQKWKGWPEQLRVLFLFQSLIRPSDCPWDPNDIHDPYKNFHIGLNQLKKAGVGKLVKVAKRNKLPVIW